MRKRISRRYAQNADRSIALQAPLDLVAGSFKPDLGP
jgi:hypothetical protein